MQVYTSPAKCLTPAGRKPRRRDEMVIGTCDGSAVQTFTQTAAGEFKVGGMCMEVQGASTAAGALAVLARATPPPSRSGASRPERRDLPVGMAHPEPAICRRRVRPYVAARAR